MPKNRSVKPPLWAFNFLCSARLGNGSAGTINNARDPSCSHGYSCRAPIRPPARERIHILTGD